MSARLPSSSDLLAAARVPASMPTGEFGLWRIERVSAPPAIGWPDFVILSRVTLATLHRMRGEIVMEDSRRELQRHLPILRQARGRVLVTGLGLGCVVRGLLASPRVDEVTVLELDRTIIDLVGPEFASDPRVSIIEADAFEFDPGRKRWDYAWHDIWREGTTEALLHAELMTRYRTHCDFQGAWGMPRLWRRIVGGDFIDTRGFAREAGHG